MKRKALILTLKNVLKRKLQTSVFKSWIEKMKRTWVRRLNCTSTHRNQRWLRELWIRLFINVSFVLLGLPTIMFIVFWDFLTFERIFILPQVKRSVIISKKLLYKELSHKLPNDSRLRILGNYDISKESQLFL